MKRYLISYKDKKVIRTGESAQDAFESYAHRPVFGRPTIDKYKLKMIDADTQGKQWAQYECGWNGNEYMAMCEICE